MFSAMNADNLSGAFCLNIYYCQAFTPVTRQRDNPMEKRAILGTKETSPLTSSVSECLPVYPEPLSGFHPSLQNAF